MKFTLTLAGPMEDMIANLAAARGISQQEAVRVVLGAVVQADRRRIPENLEIPEILQTLEIPENLENLQNPQNPPLAPAPGSSSVSSLSSPPPPDLEKQEPSLPLTPSPPKPQGSARCKKSAEGDPDFEEFYRTYPRHDGKADAAKAWRQMAGELPPLEELLASVAAQAKAKQWDLDKQFCPLPASWLRGMRWRDEAAPNGNGRPSFGRQPDIRRSAGAHAVQPQSPHILRYVPEPEEGGE